MFFGGGMIATTSLQADRPDRQLLGPDFPGLHQPVQHRSDAQLLESISPSLEESAKIDGASHFRILLKSSCRCPRPPWRPSAFSSP
jgi:hypothetical protein